MSSCRATNANSTRALVARPLPAPTYPRLIACGPASARVHVGGPVWLTPRGYVGLPDLHPSESAALASTMTEDELHQLSGLAWAAAMTSLGIRAVCRPAPKRAA